MGFLLSFLVVTAICVVLEARRHRGYWTGKPHDGVLVRRAGGLSGRRLEIGVPIAGAAEFEIRPETLIDKLSKAYGFAVELETGHAKFDQRAYVVSDDPAVRELLARDAALRSRMVALLAGAGLPDGFRTLGIVCRAGTLRVRFAGGRRADEHAVIERFAADVYALGAAIPLLPSHRVNDPGHARAIALSGVALALVVNGLLGVALLSIGTLPVTIDLGALWLRAVVIGLFITLVLGAATFAALRKTARAHGVLVEVLALAMLGGTTSAFVGLHDLNRLSDDLEATRIPVGVLTTALPLPGDYVAIDVRDLLGRHPEASRALIVPRATVGDVRAGDDLVLVERSGFFAVRWIESVEREKRAEPVAAAPAEKPDTTTTLELSEAQWQECRMTVPADARVVVVDGRPRSATGAAEPIPSTIRVEVSGPGAVVLLLTAPEAVHWVVTESGGARVAGVLASGRYAPRVSGPRNEVPRLVRSIASGHACGRSWLATGTLTLPIDVAAENLFGTKPDAVVRIDQARAVVALAEIPRR